MFTHGLFEMFLVVYNFLVVSDGPVDRRCETIITPLPVLVFLYALPVAQDEVSKLLSV